MINNNRNKTILRNTVIHEEIRSSIPAGKVQDLSK